MANRHHPILYLTWTQAVADVVALRHLTAVERTAYAARFRPANAAGVLAQAVQASTFHLAQIQQGMITHNRRI